MHNYALNSDIRKTITYRLVIISVILSAIWTWITTGKSAFSIDDFKNIVITSGSIFTALYFTYDSFLWKLKFVRKFHEIPDLNGSWVGTYKSSFKNKNGNYTTGDTSFTIKQTWSKIYIFTHSQNNSGSSTSESKMASIIINAGRAELRYEYLNRSDGNIDEKMSIHYGANGLNYFEERDSLEGLYYTDKNRKTHGIIKVSRKKNKRKFYEKINFRRNNKEVEEVEAEN